ncbi:MAG: roadblock/LC7 domain-containing protein [Actinomycetales bacterium]
MGNVDVILKDAMQIDGAVGVALVDYETGMSLGQAGGGSLDLDVAAAGNSDVVKAKLRTMAALGLEEKIEDILITLSSQYHLLRLITARNGQGLFLYMALDRSKANLAMARRQLTNLEHAIEL